MDKFKVTAPKGTYVAYREIVAPDGKPVLGIHTGAYLQRLGSLRESSVYIIEDNGEQWDCIICEFGGVIRELRKWMNGKPNQLEKNFSLNDKDLKKLDAIKSKYS